MNENIIAMLVHFVIAQWTWARNKVGNGINKLISVVTWSFAILGLIIVLALINKIFDINAGIFFLIIVTYGTISLISIKSKVLANVLTILCSIATVLLLMTLLIPGTKDLLSSRSKDLDNAAFSNFIPYTDMEKKTTDAYKQLGKEYLDSVDALNKKGRFLEAVEVMNRYNERGLGLKKALENLREKNPGLLDHIMQIKFSNDNAHTYQIDSAQIKRLLTCKNNAHVRFLSDQPFSVLERTTEVYNENKIDYVPMKKGEDSYDCKWGGTLTVYCPTKTNLKVLVE